MALKELIDKALKGRLENDPTSWSDQLADRIAVFIADINNIKDTADEFPNPERGKYYDKKTGFVGCDIQTLTREREEAHLRALFNLKRISIDECNVDLIDYEVRVGENCKLDLLGKSSDSDTYFAIEYKIREGGSTDLEYAILESLAYSILLSRKTGSAANFLVAGPLSYFHNYLVVYETSSDQKKNRLARIIALEKMIRNEFKYSFSGYFVLADTEKKLLMQKTDMGYITPHFYLQMKNAEAIVDSIPPSAQS